MSRDRRTRKTTNIRKKRRGTLPAQYAAAVPVCILVADLLGWPGRTGRGLGRLLYGTPFYLAWCAPLLVWLILSFTAMLRRPAHWRESPHNGVRLLDEFAFFALLACFFPVLELPAFAFPHSLRLLSVPLLASAAAVLWNLRLLPGERVPPYAFFAMQHWHPNCTLLLTAALLLWGVPGGERFGPAPQYAAVLLAVLVVTWAIFRWTRVFRPREQKQPNNRE